MAARDPSSLMLVTGASGWLGRRLVRALTKGCADMGSTGAGGHDVRCLVPANEPTTLLRSLGVAIVSGDIRDPDACAALCRRAEGATLFHLAGIIHPPGRTAPFESVNVTGTATLVEAARHGRLRRMIAVSSNSPLGFNPSPEHRFTEQSPYHPYMGYGRSKWRMEFLLNKSMTDPKGPEIVIVRAPWFYGPEQPARQTEFFKMVRKGTFPLVGCGRNRRSLAYVDSLALGLLLCAKTPAAAGETYWIADETPYAMTMIVQTIRTVMREDFGLAASDRLVTLPSWVSDVARLADSGLQGVGLYSQKVHVLSEMNLTIACDIGKAKRELGYRPLVDLREGMRRSISWCLEHAAEGAI